MLTCSSFSTGAPRLVAVCSSKNDLDEFRFEKRQIPLVADDDCPMFVMQFEDMTGCFECERQQLQHNHPHNPTTTTTTTSTISMRFKKDYDLFLHKYNQLMSSCESGGGGGGCSTSNSSACGGGSNCSKSEGVLFEAKPFDLLNTMSQLVPCIGCRTSVERFYKQLVQQQLQQSNKQALTQTNSKQRKNFSAQRNFSNALDPIMINSQGNLTLKKSLLQNPVAVFKLFYKDGANNFHSILDSILKSKKNRRCHLHSMDAHKQRSINDWIPVWDALANDECRKKTIIVDTLKLLLTLDNYLRKHNDCKMKVIRAFNILTGELDPSKEKGFCASLYAGLECCCPSPNAGSDEKKNAAAAAATNPQQHIHVLNDKQFVASLIQRAESEIHGNRRERHAKTLDIAQEEVLTCIGVYLYERFQKIYQAMRAEEQTWLLLFYTGVFALKKSFELECERRQGVSNLELICAEFEALNESRLNRKQLKKQRKKQRKQTHKEEKQQTKSDQDQTNTNNQNKSSIKCESCYATTNNTETSCSSSQSSSSSSMHSSRSSSASSIEIVDEIEASNELDDDEDEELSKNCCLLNKNEPDNNEDMCIQCEASDQVKSSIKCECEASELNEISLFSSFCSSSSSSSTNTIDNPTLFRLDNLLELSFFDSALSNEEGSAEANNFDLDLITDEEKMEYYANKSILLNERLNRRELLKQRFQNLKLNANFKIRPRNIS